MSFKQNFDKMSKSLRYSGKLIPVEPGHVITISGKTTKAAEYFDFFLGSDNGTSEDFGDVQFHVAINFTGSGEIVRNSYTKQMGWDMKEERKQNLFPNNIKNPLKRGGEFRFSIYVDTSMFFLSINEKPFCTYAHRKPLSDIRRINIFGDVERIFQVTHSATQQAATSPTIYESTFTASIPTIKPNTAVVFSGTPMGCESGHLVISFSDSSMQNSFLQIVSKFQTGEIIAVTEDDNLGYEVDIIYFTFNSKNHMIFHLYFRHKITVVPQEFPFKVGEPFKAAIGITKQGFVFTVNGQNILHCPIENISFFDNPITIQVTSCDSLNIQIHSVDVFGMEGDRKPTASEMMLKKPLAIYDNNKILAKIYHH